MSFNTVFYVNEISQTPSRTATAPVDRLKIFLQVHHQSREAGYYNTFKYMVQKGGWRSLWRGNAVNCAKIFPEQGLFFFV